MRIFKIGEPVIAGGEYGTVEAIVPEHGGSFSVRVFRTGRGFASNYDPRNVTSAGKFTDEEIRTLHEALTTAEQKAALDATIWGLERVGGSDKGCIELQRKSAAIRDRMTALRNKVEKNFPFTIQSS